MGGKDRDPRGPAITQCKSDIATADFVALDFEFSGLFLDVERGGGRQRSLADYFKKCVESIPEFLPLQIGICCARQQGETWELRTHQFNLWPQSRRLFTSDFQSLKFLRSHGFDFNDFLDNGYPVSRIPRTQDKKSCGRALSANQLVQALRDAKVPLVFHNGLLDILHLYVNFVDDLPADLKEFGDAWVSQFPLLFDTRYLAQEGQFNLFRCAGGLTLEQLHQHLVEASSGLGISFKHFGPLFPGGQAHGSSGQDALMTGQVFILELELWLRHSAMESQRKRQRKHRMQEIDSELRQLDWQAVHARANDLGINLFRSVTIEGRFGGSVGARKPVAEIRAAIVALQYSNEIDKQDSLRERANGSEESSTLRPQQSLKRPAPSEDGAMRSILSREAIASHQVCRRFHNRIAIVGASPGMIHLGAHPEASATGVQKDPEASALKPLQ